MYVGMRMVLPKFSPSCAVSWEQGYPCTGLRLLECFRGEPWDLVTCGTATRSLCGRRALPWLLCALFRQPWQRHCFLTALRRRNRGALGGGGGGEDQDHVALGTRMFVLVPRAAAGCSLRAGFRSLPVGASPRPVQSLQAGKGFLLTPAHGPMPDTVFVVVSRPSSSPPSSPPPPSPSSSWSVVVRRRRRPSSLSFSRT